MKIKFKSKPEIGDIRTKTKFLWFPKIIDRELRWLCKTTWKEEYTKLWDSFKIWTKYIWMD